MHGIVSLLIIFYFAVSTESAFDATRDTFFVLYTKDDPVNGQNIAASVASLNASTFNPLYPTRIIIHGWLSDHTFPVPIEIKDAYIKKGNFNVILVDWGAGALNLDYLTAVSQCINVADEIAKLVRFLVANNSTTLRSLIFTGYSLGAHIAGFVGKQIPNIHAIVGLEPAGPGYSQYAPSARLSSTDATIVQVIHTTSTVGAWYLIGTCDFFVNNGICQPGCYFFDPFCSHSRAADYFAESINSFGFKVKGTYMGGEPLATGLSGSYSLTTNSKSPFAKG